MRSIVTSLWFAIALGSSLPMRSAAHDGPEHEIEVLTERMKNSGESAALLAERAVEYRVLGKLGEATKDLERAVLLEPGSLVIHRELARVLFLDGKPKDALPIINRGLNLESDEPSHVASARILRAEILRAEKDPKKALEDCDAAINLHAGNPEWYVLRSDLHKRLKLSKERLEGIEAGLKETGAGILEIERVEALTDAGQFQNALTIIEPELRDSRVKSSWSIRRARALIGLGRKEEAEADLKSALVEIGTRLNAKTPDAPLLLDKALAHELLNETRPALRAYREARDKGAARPLDDKIKALEKAIETPSSAPPTKQ